MTIASLPTISKTTVADVYIDRLIRGETLLPESPHNTMEVVGILKSYGHVLYAYQENLRYIADHQFLVLFPFFKYMNGDRSFAKLKSHLWHDRINYEFAEYCMKAMLWHGGGGMDAYLDTPEFEQLAGRAIAAKIKSNPIMQGVHQVFNQFLLEQVRQMCYYSALGQFWDVMSQMFLNLSDAYDRGEISSISAIVDYVKAALVAAAGNPITYAVEINGQTYDILPASAGLTFLPDVAVPYVEAVFFRSLPFLGTISYNAQDEQVPREQEQFNYGALYADPLPVGGSGIPPTLLMQDMVHFLPDYLRAYYAEFGRGEADQRVKICASFQKSMFCVTNAVIWGLAPQPLDSTDPVQLEANQRYFKGWIDRLMGSQLGAVQLFPDGQGTDRAIEQI
jgi:CO2 hydration protein